ncbi:hypothetical protein V7O66_11725 [Methanolobus sp. ZRKC3]|uniref:DUF7288 family protein n=1 Tax=Methanolobus sp. ZRKC3 TaxID=3125786 RepID=UPI003251EDA4
MTLRTIHELKNDTFAQMHTLEALMAALIMVGIIVFTVQATSLTPLTSSTANAHIEAQLQAMGQDMLNVLSYSPYGDDSDLKKDIINWDGKEYVWDGNQYESIDSQNKTLDNSSFVDILSFIAIPRGIAHNVDLAWVNDNGISSSKAYIYNGDPSNNAVIVSKKLVLSNTDVGDASAFFATTGIADADDSTDFYNIVNVRLTLWRM